SRGREVFSKIDCHLKTAEDPEFKRAMEMMRPEIGARLVTEEIWLGLFWTRNMIKLMDNE
ncbi:Hypothetical protein FKW44_016207, partial [Caligus rogercresseyi]